MKFSITECVQNSNDCSKPVFYDTIEQAINVAELIVSPIKTSPVIYYYDSLDNLIRDLNDHGEVVYLAYDDKYISISKVK